MIASSSGGTGEIGTTSPQMDQALDVLLPRGSAFELSRSYVARALTRFSSFGDKSGGGDEMNMRIPMADREIPGPIAGDILISAGLDWDNKYSNRFYSMARQQGIRIVTCCYDLIPVLFPQYCVGDVAKRFAEYFMDLTWGSEAILCISEHTRRDYMKHFCLTWSRPSAGTSKLCPWGDNLPVGSPDIGGNMQKIAQAPFILYVSTIERRKNHEVLYRAYHLLARQGLADELPTLVFVGMPGWGIGDLLKDIELDPLIAGKIVQLNHVTDGELEFLYRKARFCVYPSLYEGWGLPVGEALSIGKAIISSGEASLREVGGDLLRYVSPWDPYAWAEAIYEYIEKPLLVEEAESRVRSNYIPRKWKDTAAVVASLLEEMISERAPDGENREFLPGYDMDSECGLHWGPSIRTVGRGGILMSGPGISAQPGKYQLQLLGSITNGHEGSFVVEVASNAGKEVHFSGLYDSSHEQEGVLANCEFELLRYAQNLDIRCRVEPTCAMELRTVRLSALHAEATR